MQNEMSAGLSADEKSALSGVSVPGDVTDSEPIGPDHLTRADIDHLSACLETIAELCDALLELLPAVMAAAAGAKAVAPSLGGTLNGQPIKRRG